MISGARLWETPACAGFVQLMLAVIFIMKKHACQCMACAGSGWGLHLAGHTEMIRILDKPLFAGVQKSCLRCPAGT